MYHHVHGELWSLPTLAVTVPPQLFRPVWHGQCYVPQMCVKLGGDFLRNSKGSIAAFLVLVEVLIFNLDWSPFCFCFCCFVFCCLNQKESLEQHSTYMCGGQHGTLGRLRTHQKQPTPPLLVALHYKHTQARTHVQYK